MLLKMPEICMTERMIGDIDILVDNQQINFASKILKENNYNSKNNSNIIYTDNLKKYQHKHLPRLISDKYIAAVELHQEVLIGKFAQHITSKNILSSKEKIRDKYFIPSDYYLWKHAIMNWQLNDNGYFYNFLSFRSVRDVLILEQNNFCRDLSLEPVYIKHFYELMSVHFDTYNKSSTFNVFMYKLQIKYSLFNKLIHIINKLIFLIKISFDRLLLLFTSKMYFKNVFSNPKIIFTKIKYFLSK